MAKTILPTNYVDDVLNGAMDGKRRYREIPNADGTISLEDATAYDQIGSNFGAAQLNLMSENINQSFDSGKMLKTMDEVNAVTQEGYGVDALVVKQVNNSLGGLQFGVDENGNYGYIKAGADTVTPFKQGIEYVEGGIGAPLSNATIVTFPVDSFSQIIITSGSGILNQYDDFSGTSGISAKGNYSVGTYNVDDLFDSGKYFSMNSYAGATTYKLVPR